MMKVAKNRSLLNLPLYPLTIKLNPQVNSNINPLPKLSLVAVAMMGICQPALATINSLSEKDTMQIQTQSQAQAQEAEQSPIGQLSQSVIWKRLLHYPDGGATSRANSADFFVSPEGSTNPTAEMHAMLNAMMSVNDGKKGDKSVQCRFPARTHWLKEQLNLTLPTANCAKYDQWFNQHNPKRLAVVFAQEYPDSMTSAFAHTLLRIDTTDNAANNNFQESFAINYTVDGDTSHRMPKYAINSMTGAYAGMMTIEPYLPKIEGYVAKDQRDVWTYELNLTAEENRQIVRHIWEVQDLGLPYYFLTDNCSSEILRLVDAVRPQSALFAKLSQFVIPSEVIRLLDDKGLLVNSHYLPAQNSLKQATINRKNSLNPQNTGLDNVAQAVADNDPIEGNDIKRLSVGVGQQGEYNYVELAGRISYHDLLDRPTGYRQNMDMETLKIKVRGYTDSDTNSDSTSDSLQLQEFLLLGGHSYNPINTVRKGGSWGIELGAKQVMDASANYENSPEQYARGQEHLVGNIGYEKGVSYAFGKPNTAYELPKQLCYAFGGGDVQVGQGLTNGFRLGVGANIGCVYKMNDRFRAKAELNLPYWYHGDTQLQGRTGGYWQPIASLGVQYDIAKNHGIRLSAVHELSRRVEEDTDVQLAWQWYF